MYLAHGVRAVAVALSVATMTAVTTAAATRAVATTGTVPRTAAAPTAMPCRRGRSGFRRMLMGLS